jgi:hypothetical protein
MADVPVNEKLYAMVVFQAKAKYRIYPSPGASHWVHQRYIELGGKFVDSAELAEKKKLLKAVLERHRELRARGDNDKEDNKKKRGDK